METSGSRRIAAPTSVVLAGLGDPEILVTCIPKCQSLTGTMAQGFDFIISHKLGPIPVSFRGHITFVETIPQTAYDMQITAAGGLAGSVTVNGRVELAGIAGATQLGYSAQTQLSGWKSVLGGERFDHLFEHAIGLFFERFTLAVERR